MSRALVGGLLRRGGGGVSTGVAVVKRRGARSWRDRACRTARARPAGSPKPASRPGTLAPAAPRVRRGAGAGSACAPVDRDDFDRRDAAAEARAVTAFEAAKAQAIELGGTIPGEDGVGALRRGLLTRQLGAASLALHHRIKDAFDPDGIPPPREGARVAPRREASRRSRVNAGRRRARPRGESHLACDPPGMQPRTGEQDPGSPDANGNTRITRQLRRGRSRRSPPRRSERGIR
ncbi:FAD-linked oxidase C-terminal domain-containing protein [Sorangium sp. So ce341]|uniref:FAD-linked oxidase C-terminal domain-containing protein n=1 Tax=Sorangium sp. So ce341 TaxID=3133302 RepID=UPI003F5E4724